MSEPAFHCRRCGTCCQGRGGVRLDRAEAARAAAFLGLGEADFRRLYLEPGEPPWDIGLDEAGFCLFHQPGGLCLIHPVKPAVCRLWPFQILESALQEAGCACPGLKAGLTPESPA